MQQRHQPTSSIKLYQAQRQMTDDKWGRAEEDDDDEK